MMTLRSPLLQKKGMDAFLQALNDPATTNPDDRTDKQYSRPEGKGTELEDMKSPSRVEDMAPFQRVNGSAKTRFTGLWKDIRNPHTTDLPPSMRLDAPGGCPSCGGGLTRHLNEDGEIEEVCTQCEYGPKKTGAAKPKCPHCGSSEYSLMPTDFETAKCDKCGKNWNHGIVEGINDPPKMAKKAYGINVAYILHPKKFAAENAPDPGQYDEEHEDHVRDEAKQWAQYAELGDNTEEIKPYDPSGNYLCGTCDMRQGENQCMRVNGPISFEKGSCRLYHKGAPENRLPMKKKFTQAEAKYSESDQGGFGCHRCEYGGKAKGADSAGRESWCSFWGMHINPMSCCAESEPERKGSLVRIAELEEMKIAAKWDSLNFANRVGWMKSSEDKGFPFQSSWAQLSPKHRTVLTSTIREVTHPAYNHKEALLIRKVSGNKEQALRKVVDLLGKNGIGSIVVGAIALQEHGFPRNTKDIDLSVSNFTQAKTVLVKNNYQEVPNQSITLRDMENQEDIDLIQAGKPVAASDVPMPMPTSVNTSPVFCDLATLIDLKIGSLFGAMSIGDSTGRMQDNVDINKLVVNNQLPRDLMKGKIHQEDYEFLWDDIQKKRSPVNTQEGKRASLLVESSLITYMRQKLTLKRRPDYGGSDSYVTVTGSLLLKKKADWTMTCPWCKGTARKDKPTDDFKCTGCDWTSKEAPKAMAQHATVDIHETPTKLPPRDDMRGHLDEEVKEEMIESIDAPIMEGAKGVHVSAEGSLEFQRFLEPGTRDMKHEAQLAFMRDPSMQQEAQEAGMFMEEFWGTYGDEYANEYFAGRRASKTAMKVEEGINICPKCTSNNVEEVTDGETKGGDSQIRLFECTGCNHLFSL